MSVEGRTPMATFRVLPGLMKSDPKQISRSVGQIPCDHRAHATGTTQLRGHGGQ
jgi:hypothetical protein